MLLLAVLVLVGTCVADPIKYQDCGSVKGSITKINVHPCPKEPCLFKRGTNVTATVIFNSKEESKGATTVVHGIIGGIPVPFPVPKDCCKNKNLKCPVKSGPVVYNEIIFVKTEYPKITLTVKWEIKDDNGDDLVCFVFPAEITD